MKIIYHPITVLIFSLVSIIFFISLNKTAQKTEISNQNIESLENEVKQISEDVIDLEGKIIETESEEFQEKVIRNELLMQKPGEKVIRLPSLEEMEESVDKNDDRGVGPVGTGENGESESQSEGGKSGGYGAKTPLQAWMELFFGVS